MADIDVDRILSQLTLDEKVALTAGESEKALGHGIVEKRQARTFGTLCQSPD